MTIDGSMETLVERPITDRDRIENGEDPLHGDPMDLCSRVLGVICEKCPQHGGKCMKDDDGFFNTHHDQMCICLAKYAERMDGKFPEPDEITEDPAGECTGCCEDIAGTLIDLICRDCKLFGSSGECMPNISVGDGEDGVNYVQLEECFDDMVLRLMKVYPLKINHPWASQK